MAAVRRHPEGASIAELEREFPSLPRRTLQRTLAALVKDGLLLPEGSHRGRKYRVPTDATDQEALPLSTAGAEVAALVRRPLTKRKPVGYRGDFLRSYSPNRSSYLPLPLRRHLEKVGRTSPSKRPAGTYARQILSRLLIDLSCASSRLEGNTYSRLDTENLIRFGRSAAGKDTTEAQMILNHKAAIELLIEQAEEVGFNRYTFQNLHALLSENLLADPSASGRLRTIEVGISGTVYQPLAIPQQVEEYFDLFLTKARAITDPFEQAFFVMVQLPYLQPFQDMNKRLSRVALNIPLVKANLVPLSFVDVPDRLYLEGTLGVYELNRIELLRDVFAWAYERSCERFTVIQDTLPAPDPFRIRHREAIIEVVSELVRKNRTAREREIRKLATRVVPAEDLEAFVGMVSDDLRHLHEGNISRYRLRLAEYRRWQSTSGRTDP